MNEEKENQVVYLRLDDIIPNRFQPREVFDETGLQELADSIKEHGVIQPIIVRQIGDKYELIAGERRCKASALAGLTTIPAIIRDMDDKESAKVSLLENLQRRNLSAIEEARTYKRILELDNMTQEDLARTMGRSQPMVANKLRLLSLPEEVQDALMKNQISERHARSLLTLPNKEEQLKFLDKIRQERLTVRELDALIKEYKNNGIIEGVNDLNNETNKEQSNSFNERSNNMNNNRSNFGGMGLNDYQSSVSNNMFNNIPNNFNNMPNDINNSSDNQFNYNDFNEKNDSQSNNQTNTYFEELNNSNNNNNNNTSLGSMFDSQNNIPENYQVTSNDNSNLFVSHIREDNLPKVENQFLPNFDEFNHNNNYEQDDDSNNGSRESFNNFSNGFNDFNQKNNNDYQNNFNLNNNFGTNNTYQDQNNFMNNNYQDQNSFNMNNNYQGQNSFNMNNNYQDNNFGINNGFNDFNPNYNTMNQGYNNFNQTMNPNYNNIGSNIPNNNYFMNDLNNNANYNQPGNFNQPNNYGMNSFDQYNNINNSFNQIPNNNGMNNNVNNQYMPNQGNMFEQPLNIVDVPKQDNNYELPNDNSFNELENKEEKVDNPLDDQYENILFAKPVPIKEEQEEVESKEINEEKELEDTKEMPVVSPDIEIIGESETHDVSTNQEEVKPKNEYISLDPVNTIHTTLDAVLELKKTTDRIKQNNIDIETEEIEFDDLYQITIKIKKADN